MDFARAFTYLFSDPRWLKKVGIYVGISIVSILVVPGFFLAGYNVRIIQRVAAEERGLPEWDEWGKLFLIGLKYTAAAVLMIAALLASLVLLGVISKVAGKFIDVLFLVLFLPALAAFVFAVPAITILLAKTESVADAVNPRKIVGLVRSNFGNYAKAFAVAFSFYIVLAAGTRIPLIDLILVLFVPYQAAVSNHLYGQVLGLASARMAGEEA